MASIHDILRPITLTKVVSRQMAAERWLLGFFGVEPGGRNEVWLGHGREGSYQIFDNTRKLAKGRAPATAAARSRRQRVGRVPVIYPRMHDSTFLSAEELHNLSKIGDPRERDEAGAQMITMQTRYLAQKAANWRAAQVMGVLRDELYYDESGDDWWFTFTSAGSLAQLPAQMPAGNKNQLDMLGGGNIITTPWDNPSADIPKQISNVQAAFEEIYGGKAAYALIQHSVWQDIINNDHVASQAGIANPPFTEFQREVGVREDGSPVLADMGKIAGSPDLTFIITDAGLDLGAEGSEVFTKYVGDDQCIFCPDPQTTEIFSYQLGSEPIAEYDGGPETTRVGLSTWTKKVSNPTGTEIFGLDNGLFLNHIPNSVARATVRGF